MPGTRSLLRLSVWLPIASVFFLGLTAHWREAEVPDSQVIALMAVALTPVLLTYLPWAEQWLGALFLPAALSVYLLSQAILSSLLHNWGLVRFDWVQVGPIYVLEPGVLLMIPLLLIAWQYGFVGALVASATAGTVHMLVGVLLHWLMPGMHNLATLTPILRPDLLYLLPLVVAYFGTALRRQQRLQAETQTQWREFAATSEVLAVERERRRLAKQLENTLGDSLQALNEQLNHSQASIAALSDGAASKLQRTSQQVRHDLRATQQMIGELQATPLESLGLIDALHSRAAALAERIGVEVEVDAAGVPESITDEQELVLFYVADRAMAHMAGHDGTSHIHLRLAAIDHFVALTIHDDGQCRCQSHAQGQHELNDLEACTQLIGGHFCFTIQGQQGNTLAVWMPCGREP